jgi:hypothetical protein
VIRGKDIKAQRKIGEEYYDIFCAKSCNITTEIEPIEVTNATSTSARVFEPGMESSLMTVSGVSEIDNANDRVSIFYLWQQARTSGEWRVFITDINGDTYAITFTGWVRTTSLTGDVIGFNDSQIVVVISGDLDLGDIVADPEPPACEVQDPLYIDVVAGEYSVASALLEQDGVTILSVARSGAEHYYTSGTPISLQYTTNLADGEIIFDSNIPFNTGEIIYVLYKIAA